MYEPEIQEIVAAIRSGKCAIFVGAGLSIGAGLPSGASLAQSLLDELRCQTNADFQTIAQAYAYTRGRKDLEEKVQKVIDITNKKPTENHRLIASLGVDILITTNYDDLLERELDCPQNNIIIEDTDLVNTNTKETLVVKIHGDLRRPHTIVLTKNDYFLCYRKRELIWNYVSVLLAQRSFVFLGYSLRDPDFSQMQAQLIHYLGQNIMKRSYAVLFGADEIQASDLLSRNMEIIDLSRLGYNNRKEAMHHFLSMLNITLNSSPSISSEIHDGKEGEILVPEDLRVKLQNLGCDFVSCIEYRIYCNYLDEGQFISIPHGWTPPLPNKFRSPEFHVETYYRSDFNMMNIWVGLAVGRFREKPAGKERYAG